MDFQMVKMRISLQLIFYLSLILNYKNLHKIQTRCDVFQYLLNKNKLELSSNFNQAKLQPMSIQI